MRLAINIDHIATLRNARGGSEPDPVAAARVAEDAGAAGIVCHLREDRRHIRDHDVARLRATVSTKLDLEMAATSELVVIARRLKPDLVTLVPEKRRELTTEGGLDIVRLRKSLQNIVSRLCEKDIAVSLFIDPIKNQIDASKEVGAQMIEIHTGEYANARTRSSRLRELRRIESIARYALSLGLGVNAGHGLDYNNIRMIARIKEIEEVSIGHAVIARGMEVGLRNAVREMFLLLRESTRRQNSL